MKPITCGTTRRLLPRFHDRELPIADQIAVAAHLEWCTACAEALADFQAIGRVLRATAREYAVLSSDEASSLQAAVVNRMRAERAASVFARVRAMFDDWHLVYAGLGAAAATVACVIVMLGMMRFATIERPDSLAAIVNLLASPGSNENPVAIDNRVLLPRAVTGPFSVTANDDAEQDAVFALAAVVTREGRIANLELLRSFDPQRGDAKLVERLMDAVSRSRFEPARFGDVPVAVNMVWLVAHTTVRASKRHSIDLPVPTAKKRIADGRGRAAAIA